MVVVAQLVRAPDCGSGGRRFETDLPPKKTKPFRNEGLFLWEKKVLLLEKDFLLFLHELFMRNFILLPYLP